MKKIIIFISILFNFVIINAQFIQDKGHFFSENEISNLNQQIKEIKNNTKTQILVYTILDLKNQDSKNFATNIFNEYGVGVKGINNGLLIFLSKYDRRMEIINGLGMEWILSDIETLKIANNVISDFKKQEYYLGVHNIISNINEKIDRNKWIVSDKKLKDASKKLNHHIFKLSNYTVLTKTVNKNNFKKTNHQFSIDYFIRIKINNDYFKVFYSKNMENLIQIALKNTNIQLYVRLKDWDSKKLELLGTDVAKQTNLQN